MNSQLRRVVLSRMVSTKAGSETLSPLQKQQLRQKQQQQHEKEKNQQPSNNAGISDFVDTFKSVAEMMQPTIEKAIKEQKQDLPMQTLAKAGGSMNLSGLLSKSNLQAIKNSSGNVVETLSQDKVPLLFQKLDLCSKNQISLDEVAKEFSLSKNTLMKLQKHYQMLE